MATTKKPGVSILKKTMGIFGKLFGRSEPEVETPVAEIYMHREYLDRLLIDRMNWGQLVLLTFFPETLQRLQSLCTDEQLKSKIVLNTDAVPIAPNIQISFAERYPTQQKETETIQRLRAAGYSGPLTAYCSLDDRIMKSFGGDRMMAMMISMGLTETESIRHKLISSSVTNAQKKTLKKITYEQQAKSPDEWYRLNLRAD